MLFLSYMYFMFHVFVFTINKNNKKKNENNLYYQNQKVNIASRDKDYRLCLPFIYQWSLIQIHGNFLRSQRQKYFFYNYIS